MPMPEALVDVLIPVYNGGDNLKTAIDSITTQTISDIRIIAVDDGSTDGSGEVLAKLATADPRIQVVTQPNGGIVKALNTGLAHCTARYLARMDADDIAYPDRLEKQVAHLEANPECIAVGSAARHVDADGLSMNYVARLHDPQESDPEWIPSREPCIIHPTLLTYTQAVKDLGGYRQFTYAEDIDLFWRLQERGRLDQMDEPLIDYRIHIGSLTGQSVQNGRISAIWSQLAGLSAKRRRAGQTDFEPPDDWMDRYRNESDLTALYRSVLRLLNADEAKYLKVAVAAKLLELVGYRPYRLEPHDRIFIRRTLTQNLKSLSPANRAKLLYEWTDRAGVWMLQKQARAGLQLIPLRHYPRAIRRMAIVIATSKRVKRWAYRLVGRKYKPAKADG
jgi:glycosyltransferase involved in cell wall biosynthesis